MPQHYYFAKPEVMSASKTCGYGQNVIAKAARSHG
jgi:hypothetical protein